MMAKWQVSLFVLCAVANQAEAAGGDRDDHGCIGSAGYVWCESSQKCLRVWEEECESFKKEVAKLQEQESNFEGGDYQTWMKPKQTADAAAPASESLQVADPTELIAV
eukprot:gnl/MRDRNA2_/MRDRNA2_70913_c0_seq1.p1 gnl/MRDRNA2_/MRDRNA2_70913_c0~~gnl/MRDRNA2_/MRDRNA2_70913_c0_seq1.p1  ORF type:complete len:108 (+),score=36.10 gnl/MRDRNA2_/MRDRNA2_70913_c0_seq1:107-430(+)